MIDVADTQTVDLFPAPKKARGRPKTGQAKSNAERQSDYRRKKRRSGDNGNYNLNVWVSSGAKFALLRLARHSVESPEQILERLILAEQDRVTHSMDDLSEEYENYYRWLDL